MPLLKRIELQKLFVWIYEEQDVVLEIRMPSLIWDGCVTIDYQMLVARRRIESVLVAAVVVVAARLNLKRWIAFVLAADPQI